MTSNFSERARQSISLPLGCRDIMSHSARSLAADQATGGGSTKSPRLKGKRMKTVKWFSISAIAVFWVGVF